MFGNMLDAFLAPGKQKRVFQGLIMCPMHGIDRLFQENVNLLVLLIPIL